jgi:hypothetical protein
MNGRAICLKCFLEIDIFPFLQIAQKGECKAPHLGEGTPLTSNVLGRE